MYEILTTGTNCGFCFLPKLLMLYKHIRESCTIVNRGGPGSFYQQLRWPTTAHLCRVWGDGGEISCSDCVCVCVLLGGGGIYNSRLMKARGFSEMDHEASVQLMLQLCSKDSPAVLRISPCAYVIRIHGTAARPGASDPENVEWDKMGGKRMDGWCCRGHKHWSPNIRPGFVEPVAWYQTNVLWHKGNKKQDSTGTNIYSYS